jgi:hypothetical protein
VCYLVLQKDPAEMKSGYNNPKYAKKIAELKVELARFRKLYKVPANQPSEKLK